MFLPPARRQNGRRRALLCAQNNITTYKLYYTQEYVVRITHAHRSVYARIRIGTHHRPYAGYARGQYNSFNCNIDVMCYTSTVSRRGGEVNDESFAVTVVFSPLPFVRQTRSRPRWMIDGTFRSRTIIYTKQSYCNTAVKTHAYIYK